MADLSDVLTINLTSQTSAPSANGYGMPLLLSQRVPGPDRVTIIESADDVAALEFETGSPEIAALAAIYSQTRPPPQVAIGRIENKPALQYTIKLTPGQTIAAGDVFKFGAKLQDGSSGGGDQTPDGYNILSYTAEDGDTNDDVIAGLAAILTGEGAPPGITATVEGDSGEHVLVLTCDEGVWLNIRSLDYKLIRLWIAETTADGTEGTDAQPAVVQTGNGPFTIPAGNLIINTVTVSADLSAISLTSALKTAIDAASIPGLTASDIGGKVVLSHATAIVLAGATDVLTALGLTAGTTNATPAVPATGSVTEDLDAIKAENNDWYMILSTYRSYAMIDAIAGWTEQREKMFLAQTMDSAVAGHVLTDADDIAARLASLTRARTALIYAPDSGVFSDAAWASACLAFTPGEETWAFKNLAGIAAIQLTPQQETNLKAKYVNYFVTIARKSVTMGGGKVAGNQYIDIIRGRDSVMNQLAVGWFTLETDNPKVPYTETGFTMARDLITRTLHANVTAPDGNPGLLDGDSIVVTESISVANQNPTDRTNRKAKGINFSARYQGAIGELELNGTFTF